MARRLTVTEKLAMDICWRGFTAYRPQVSKAAYWRTVPADAKRRYMEHAAEMIWWTRRLGAERLAAAVKEHDAKASG